jgi:hypothetical protein
VASRYKPIWEELKKKKETSVRCRAAKARTLIQAVKKQKAKENAPKVSLDLPSFGVMKTEIKELADGMVRVIFRLIPATRAEDL